MSGNLTSWWSFRTQFYLLWQARLLERKVYYFSSWLTLSGVLTQIIYYLLYCPFSGTILCLLSKEKEKHLAKSFEQISSHAKSYTEIYDFCVYLDDRCLLPSQIPKVWSCLRWICTYLVSKRVCCELSSFWRKF